MKEEQLATASGSGWRGMSKRLGDGCARHALRAYLAFGRMAIPLKVAVFLICTLPLMWGGVFLEIRNLRKISEEESHRATYNMSLAFAQEVTATVTTVDLSLIGLRANWMRNPNDFQEIVQRLRTLLKNKVIFQVSVTNAQGDLVFADANSAFPAASLADSEDIRIHAERKEDTFYISKPIEDKVSKKWSVRFTRPVYTPDGRFDGVIVASVEPAYFSRFYQQLELGEDASVTLALADGTVLARTSRSTQDKGMGLVMREPKAENRTRTLAGNFRHFSQVDGIERFYSWRALPDYGLTVVVGQSVREGYARYAHQESVYLNAGIAGTLGLVGLALAMAFASRYRRQVMQSLADAETRLKLALKGAKEGVWDWDLVNNTSILSERAQEILRVDTPVFPCSLESLQKSVHPEDVTMITKALSAHLSGKASDYSVEHRIRGRDGDWVWILARGIVTERARDGRALRMVGTFLETTERRAREESTIYIAHHDRLTRLPNRWLFSDRMQQALMRAAREKNKIGVVYFDLDGFKPVNDCHGHEMGDKLLKAVAERVKNCLRGSDTIARIGGDEFAILLPKIDTEADTMKVAANVLRSLNEPFKVDGLRLAISGSVGIATYPEDGMDEETLLRHADAAMYQAKREGRNRICRYQDRAASISASVSVPISMPAALPVAIPGHPDGKRRPENIL
jgi:diguanylate cyclase (GGDEF)-like protein